MIEDAYSVGLRRRGRGSGRPRRRNRIATVAREGVPFAFALTCESWTGNANVGQRLNLAGRKKSGPISDTWAHLVNAYRALEHGPMSPRHVQNVLEGVVQRGVELENAIFPVLERATRRNPIIWILDRTLLRSLPRD